MDGCLDGGRGRRGGVQLKMMKCWTPGGSAGSRMESQEGQVFGYVF